MRNRCHASWLAALLPACFHPSYDRPTCGPNDECPDGLRCVQHICGGEETIDAAVAPDAQCFGSFVRVCFATPADVPTATMTLTGDISTDTSPLCNQDNDQKDSYCVVTGAAALIASGAKIRAYGTKPLILLSTTTFDVSGEIDVSSTSGASVAQPTGAGASPAGRGLCSTALDAAGNSGGGGGSFGGRGGDGETRDGLRGVSRPAIAFPSLLRGGCPGGAGSTTASGVDAGAGGSGGGAVAIIASSIQLNGTINASGAGGHGGPAIKSGAGGGGSGGMIMLDTTSLTGTGSVFANGGGGAQGGATSGAGASGNESSAPSVAALGGSDHNKDGGSGGDGSSGVQVSGSSAPGDAIAAGGGGAGGGAAGFIHAPGIAASNGSPPSTDP